jgi:uncharacterized protein CbrC (UPF0167 family)
MADQLPLFRCHPDPLGTGSIKASDNECVCCHQARGYIYTGSVYGEDDHEEDLCPWCIADGSAHERLAVEFVDAAGVGGYGKWAAVPRAVVDEVAYRTPGFAGWQQERWFTCCNDAAVFLGPMGHKEVVALGPEAVELIRRDLGWDDGPEWQNYLRALTKVGDPTAYLFRCSHCQKLGGYSDFT